MPAVQILAAVAVLLASINIFGGFAVTRRMLAMFSRRRQRRDRRAEEHRVKRRRDRGIVAGAAYIVAALLFILSLAGLSKHETARAGVSYGIAGMAIALVATVWVDVRRTPGARRRRRVGLGLLVVAVAGRRRDRPLARTGRAR